MIPALIVAGARTVAPKPKPYQPLVSRLPKLAFPELETVDVATLDEVLRSLDPHQDVVKIKWDPEDANVLIRQMQEKAVELHRERAHHIATELAKQCNLPLPPPLTSNLDTELAELRAEYQRSLERSAAYRKGVTWAEDVKAPAEDDVTAAKQRAATAVATSKQDEEPAETDPLVEARAIIAGVDKEDIMRHDRQRDRLRARRRRQRLQGKATGGVPDPLRDIELCDPFTQAMRWAEAERAVAEYITLRVRATLDRIGKQRKVALLEREDTLATRYDESRELYDRYNELPTVPEDVYPQLNPKPLEWSPLLRPFVVEVQGIEFDLSLNNAAAVAGFVAVDLNFVKRCFAVLASNRRKHTAIALQQLQRAAKSATQSTRDAIKQIDGLTPLMDKMIRLLHDHERLRKQLKYVRAILSIVCHLCKDDADIQDQLICNSGLLYVVSLLNAPEVDITIRRKARKILEIAPYNNKVINALLSGAAIPLIVNLTKRTEDNDNLLVMLRVVSALVVNPTAAVHAYQAHVMPILLKSLASNSYKIQSYSCLCLSSILARNREAQEELRQRGGLMALVSLLGSEDISVRVQAASAVVELCRGNSTNKQAVIQGAEGAFWTLECLALEDDDFGDQLAYHCLGVIWMTSQRPHWGKRNQEERRDALRLEWLQRDMPYVIMRQYYSPNKVLAYAAHCILYDYARDYPAHVREARERYRREHPSAPIDPPDLGPLEFIIIPYRYVMGLLAPILDRLFGREAGAAEDLEDVRQKFDMQQLSSAVALDDDPTFDLKTDKQQKVLHGIGRVQLDDGEGIKMDFPEASLEAFRQKLDAPLPDKKGRGKKGKGKGAAAAVVEEQQPTVIEPMQPIARVRFVADLDQRDRTRTTVLH